MDGDDERIEAARRKLLQIEPNTPGPVADAWARSMTPPAEPTDPTVRRARLRVLPASGEPAPAGAADDSAGSAGAAGLKPGPVPIVSRAEVLARREELERADKPHGYDSLARSLGVSVSTIRRRLGTLDT